MFKYVLENNLGDVLAIIGAAICFLLAGSGSAKGVSMAGKVGSGVIAEDSSKFVPVMILEALPSTQGIYGFVVAFLIIGKVGGLSLEQGFSLIIAGLPAGVVGLISAIFQGQVAVASIGIVAKRSADMVKGVVLTLMVELFAIFALLISILMVGKV